MNRNEIITILNHALQFIDKENEVNENLIEVIIQLEEEWKDEFQDTEI